ncbi:hypothetical protein PERCYII40_2284 [Pseudomonas aeruginosa]|nr:hypothetical protein PERCYII40_2284 [Pseudomonas aeruginosa]
MAESCGPRMVFPAQPGVRSPCVSLWQKVRSLRFSHPRVEMPLESLL